MRRLGDPAGDLDALFQQRDRLRDVAHLVVHDPEVLRVAADGALVAELARDVRRVRVERDRHLEVATVDSEDAKIGDDARLAFADAELTGPRKRVLEQHAGGVEVALLGREDAGAVGRSQAGLGAPPVEREGVATQLAALADAAAQQPVAPHRRDERDGGVAVPRGDRVPERHAKVVVVAVEAFEPLALVGAAEPILGARHQLDVGAGVPVTDGACVLELFERVLTDGLEHAEPAVGTGQQALVGERRDPVERLEPAHRLGGFEREAAGEHAELREQPLGLRFEQVIAPADRGAQRLLALRRVAGAAAEQIEPAREPVEDVLRREDLDPRRRELDRQRESVEPAADLLDDAGRVVEQARVDGAGAALEQRDGRLGGQRAERELVLGGEMERRAARHHELRARRRVQDRVERGRGVEQLLEVVHDDQQLAARRLADRRLQLRTHQARIVQRGERHEPRALREPLTEPVCELQREPRLADPARPGQREQPHVRVGQHARGDLQILLAPEQRRRGQRQRRMADPPSVPT